MKKISCLNIKSTVIMIDFNQFIYYSYFKSSSFLN